MMHRFVYTCPISGLAILTDKNAEKDWLITLARFTLSVSCPACDEEHETTFSKCQAFPLRTNAPTAKAS
jgi:hypothetical protein